MVARRTAKKRARKKPKLTPEERKRNKLKREHIRSARSLFRNLGFDRVREIAETEIEIEGQIGEIDDAFLFENLLLIFEYTTSQPSAVTHHLKNKQVIFSRMLKDTRVFLSYLRTKSPVLDQRLGTKYHPDQYVIRIVYCSRYSYDESIQGIVAEPKYLDYPILKYFEKLAGVIKVSARNELFEFLTSVRLICNDLSEKCCPT